MRFGLFAMDEGSPYHILGIRAGATQREIRRAYRTLAMKHHPDRNPADPDAEEKFKHIQWAYETLSGRRRLKESLPDPNFRWGFDDPFSDFSHPFFNFYMLAKQHFFKAHDKKPLSKKGGAGGNKR